MAVDSAYPYNDGDLFQFPLRDRKEVSFTVCLAIRHQSSIQPHEQNHPEATTLPASAVTI